MRSKYLEKLLKLWADVNFHDKLEVYYCSDCEAIGYVADKDSCADCGERYSPTDECETCPKCGSYNYNTHCEYCDSKSIEELDFIVNNIEELDTSIGVIYNIIKWCESKLLNYSVK